MRSDNIFIFGSYSKAGTGCGCAQEPAYSIPAIPIDLFSGIDSGWHDHKHCDCEEEDDVVTDDCGCYDDYEDCDDEAEDDDSEDESDECTCSACNSRKSRTRGPQAVEPPKGTQCGEACGIAPIITPTPNFSCKVMPCRKKSNYCIQSIPYVAPAPVIPQYPDCPPPKASCGKCL